MNLHVSDLASWIQHRRWYATKNLAIENLEIVSQAPITFANREIQHTIVAVTTEHGRDMYQLLLAENSREYVESHVHADSVISTGEPSIYEFLGESPALTSLVDVFNHRLTSEVLNCHCQEEIPQAHTARLISTEQSNSSVVLGDHNIAKFYRRITPGINPDLEVGLALDRLESSYVPRVRGWAEGHIESVNTTLAVVHQFFPTAVDGFEHGLASVRDLIAAELPPESAGGDFAAESQRLGQAIRSIHSDLSTAFGTEQAASDQLIDTMLERLHKATSEVDALQPMKSAIAHKYERLRGTPLLVQRIHGDLHLGQVLRDPTGWKVLDFEGEPGASIERRRAMAPTARDVAAMLRSFDYAARQPLISHPEKAKLLPRTAEWARRNREAFLEGYGAELDDITAIFELDKAVYEALYEHHFRPDWIEIPLGGIARLLEE